MLIVDDEAKASLNMTEHNLFYYHYAPFTNTQLPLLKLTALYFDKLVILNHVGATWATIGADQHARKAVMQLQDPGILKTVMPAHVLAEYAGPITDAIRRDLHDREFLNLCEARGGGRWTLSLARVPSGGGGRQARLQLTASAVARVQGPNPEEVPNG